MKYISSTLYNWLTDDSCSKTQLHIYAIQSEEEYLNLDARIEHNEEQEILEYLHYESDVIPVEAIQGKEYTTYHCKLIGDFLVVEETVTIDC